MTTLLPGTQAMVPATLLHKRWWYQPGYNIAAPGCLLYRAAGKHCPCTRLREKAKPNQTQSVIASAPSDRLGFQHTPTFSGHFGWYHWTAWCSYCPCTCSSIQGQAGASSHVLKQSCHQMSPQLLLLPTNLSDLSYLTLATTASQHFFVLPRRWGEKNSVPY